jgi:hypothetical protein
MQTDKIIRSIIIKTILIKKKKKKRINTNR